MYIDNQLVFSNNQAITSTAPSTNVVDLSGFGSGNAENNVIGNTTVWGEDLGIGAGVFQPTMLCNVTTAFASSGSTATLNIQVQGSPDTAPPSSGTPSGYTTYAESGVIPAATINGLAAGSRLLGFSLPARIPDQLGNLPRFLRLNYVVASGPFTAGNLYAAIVLDRQAWDAKFYPNNYVVA